MKTDQYNTVKGFTLVELLVVISVIALMLTVLTPSLARAKKQAASVYCLSNLKQLMVAAVVYAENHHDYFPIAYYQQSVGTQMVNCNWDFTVRYQDGQINIEPGILWQGDTIEKVQQCPSFKGSSNTAGDPYTGYNYNTSYVGHGQQESISLPVKRVSLMRPSGTAIFGDGQAVSGANKFMRAPFRSEGDLTFSGRFAGTQGFRHELKTNVVWGDGRASSRSQLFTEIDPARHKSTIQDYNRLNPKSPIGFLSPDNSAYKTR